MTLHRLHPSEAILGLNFGMVEKTECGVRSAEYGGRSTECGVRSAEGGVRSLSQLKCFFRFGGDF